MPSTTTWPMVGGMRTVRGRLRPADSIGTRCPTAPRVVAFVERHPRHFPDPISAVGELIRVLGDVDPFLIVDAEGRWIEACAEVDPNFRPTAGSRGGSCRRASGASARPTACAPSSWSSAPTAARRARRHRRAADRRERGRARRRELRADDADRPRAGLRRIGVNLDVVHPGQRSARYHWHRKEEEGFLVLGGTGWLYAGDQRFRVGPGDFFAKSEGPSSRTSS